MNIQYTQKMNNECATFILRSGDLPSFASGANEKGSSNNSSHSSFTWNNIDMRAVLGEMYDKYDYFNIALVSNTSSTGAPTYTYNENRMGIVYMSGLRWKNNYDTGTKTYTPNAPIGIINFSALTATVGTIQTYNTLSFNTFGKFDQNCTINIFYKKISDNTSNFTQAGTSYPAMSFLFKIYGVKLDEKENDNRIDIK